LILIFFGCCIVYKISLPAAQDLPREMHNGEMILAGNYEVLTKNFYSYTEPDQPFANHHWLSGVFYFLLYRAVGWSGMVVFKVFFMLLTLAILFYLTVKRSDFWLAAVCSLPTMIILIGRSALRPEMFSYLFIVIFLLLLFDFEKNPGSNKIYWLIPLQLLWVNMHLYFAIGVMMVGGFLFEKLILNWKNIKESRYIKKLSVVFVGLIIMCFINPYGISGAIFALKVNKDANFPILSAELNSLSQYFKYSPKSENMPAVIFEILSGVLPLSFVWAAAYRWRKKQPIFSDNFIFYFLASVGTIGIGFYIIRALPLFAIIFMPAISANLKDGYFDLKKWLENILPTKQKVFKKTLAVLFAVGMVYMILFSSVRINPYSDRGLGLTAQSENSIKFFKENHLAGPIFNDTDIGSYLIYYLYPQEKVFVDNRFGDAYSADFFASIYLPMIRNEDRWKEGLKKYDFNILYFYHYDNVFGVRDFMYRRINDPEWSWIYADDYAIILVRNVPKNKEIIKKYGINWQNIYSRLSYLSQSADLNDQLTSADLFNLAGQNDLAENGYLKYLVSNPDNGKVWYALGSTELNKEDQSKSNANAALLFLNQAVRVGWKTPDTYSFLALAYYRLGELDKAKEAAVAELKIDPENEDGHKWISIISEAKQKLSNDNGNSK
jgi:tetratricopeptide (TPR) repeat protein